MKEGDIIEINGKKYKIGKRVEYNPKKHNSNNSINVREEKCVEDTHERFILQFAALLHDIGKPESARKNGKKNPEDAWGKTKDHDVVGEPLAYEFCKNLGMTNEDCDTIAWLVKHHMRAHQLTDIKSKCKIW